MDIYLISGPCGVGKSTVAKEIAKQLPRTALIHGDDLLHIVEETTLAWEERLQLMWKHIVAITNHCLLHQLNVVIDTVVEDELEWFCRHFRHLHVKIKYIVLRADEKTLIERITKRGDIDMIERSLFLLNQLENETPFNEPYLYDTTRKSHPEIVKDVLKLPAFDLK